MSDAWKIVKLKAVRPSGSGIARVGKILGRAGEHVDHIGLGVGLDLEVELAQPLTTL
jgi:hypothetical protein